jgi:cell division protein FtsB
MAAPSRTLKLSILGDVSNLVSSLKTGEKAADDYTKTLGDFGKKAVAAFAVVGAAATAFAVQSVKNALADESAQRKLAETLRASTTATEQQIAAVGDWIDTTSIAVGVTDDVLRPAFSRLVRSTNDVQKAQELVNLALDISVATGKPVEAVANALGKAYDGNAASLGRLGLGLDANLIKSKDTDAIFQQLTTTFGDFAENEALTTEAQFRRVGIAVDEAKEAIGAALLPIVEKLAAFLIETAVPNMNTFIAALTGKGSLAEATEDGTLGAFEFGKMVEKVIKTVYNLRGVLIATGVVIAGIFVVSKVAAAVTATIVLITALIKAYNALKASAITAGIALAFAMNPLLGVGVVAAAAAVMAGANALANRNATSTENLGVPSNLVTDYGTYTPPAFKADQYTGESFMGTTPKGGGAGGTAAREIQGAGSAAELQKRLEAISKEMSELVFRMSTGGISSTAAQAEIDALKAEMKVLTKQSEALQKQSTVNITVNGAIDPERTARQIVEEMNNSTYRGGGGGAGSLVMP